MKVQMGNILVRPAIGDKTIPLIFEGKLGNEALGGREKICHEVTIGRCEIGQGGKRPFRNQQNMHRVRRPRVVKSHQRLRLSQAFYRNNKTHMSKQPPGQPSPKGRTGQSKNHSPYFTRKIFYRENPLLHRLISNTTCVEAWAYRTLAEPVEA